MILVIGPDGNVLALHSDLIPLQEFGRMTTRRVSTIEFSVPDQMWEVVIDGVVRHSDVSRQACVEWEQEFFQTKIDNGEIQR